tara:strand:+ start:954 stop:1169 length:216 start_codon:yes stop_codon:yes gene_type:complete
MQNLIKNPQTLKQINSTTIKLTCSTTQYSVIYNGYTVSDLPNTFGFIYNEDKDKDGISEWFKYKSLTYIKK